MQQHCESQPRSLPYRCVRGEAAGSADPELPELEPTPPRQGREGMWADLRRTGGVHRLLNHELSSSELRLRSLGVSWRVILSSPIRSIVCTGPASSVDQIRAVPSSLAVTISCRRG